MNKPNSRANLDKALQRIAEDDHGGYIRIRAVVANTVVGQLLPSGTVKGGSAIKLRLGDEATRFTTDLDVARTETLDAFAESLNAALAEGWNGFTGRLAPQRPARPKGVPPQYVMRPFAVKLSYNGKPWLTVPLEVGHDEIGDADNPDWEISPDIVGLFARLGFPEPAPVPLMPLHHQAAQKIHALSEPGGKRAHDLIDLQLIDAMGRLDYTKTLGACRRLFAYRNMQPWPSPIVAGEGWRAAYDEQRKGLAVLEDIDDAVTWANGFVGRIMESQGDAPSPSSGAKRGDLRHPKPGRLPGASAP